MPKLHNEADASVAGQLSPALCDRELPHAIRHDLFGGSGAVRVWDLAPAPSLPFTAVLACELSPGGSVGRHLQEHYPEIVIGISGTGSVSVDGVTTVFGGGSVVALALGSTLALVNDSDDQPLRYLIVKAQG